MVIWNDKLTTQDFYMLSKDNYVVKMVNSIDNVEENFDSVFHVKELFYSNFNFYYDIMNKYFDKGNGCIVIGKVLLLIVPEFTFKNVLKAIFSLLDNLRLYNINKVVISKEDIQKGNKKFNFNSLVKDYLTDDNLKVLVIQ